MGRSLGSLLLKLSLLIVVITVFQSISVDATQDVNCTRSKSELRSAGRCCAIPKLASGELRAKCLQKRNDRWNSIPIHIRRRRYHNRRQYYRHKKNYLKKMYWSCVLNETGIIENGKLQEANLTQYLHKIANENEMKMVPVIEESFKFCMNFNYTNVNSTHEHARHRHPRHSSHPRNHHDRHHHIHYHHHYLHRHRYNRCHDHPENCGRLSINDTNARRLIMCVFQETFVNCVDEAWNNTESCNAKREFAQGCRLHNVTLPVHTPQTATEHEQEQENGHANEHEPDQEDDHLGLMDDEDDARINELDSEFETLDVENATRSARNTDDIQTLIDVRANW